MSLVRQGVTVSGNPEGKAVLLLHSSLSSGRQWTALVSVLNRTCRVINIDLLGYGNAPAAPESTPFSFAPEVERIESILMALHVNEFGIIAHSYGAALALKLASLHVEQVQQLALFEPVAFHLLAEDDAGLHEVQRVANGLHQFSPDAAAQCFVDYWNGDGYFAQLPERVQAAMSQQMAKVNQDFDALMGEPSSLRDYATLSCPILLLHGEHTRQSSRAVVHALARALKQAEVVQCPGGHMAPISHSESVNQRLLEWWG